MKKTRWIGALLAASMVLGVTACGSESGQSSTSSQESSQTESTKQEQTAASEQGESSGEGVEISVTW